MGGGGGGGGTQEGRDTCTRGARHKQGGDKTGDRERTGKIATTRREYNMYYVETRRDRKRHGETGVKGQTMRESRGKRERDTGKTNRNRDSQRK